MARACACITGPPRCWPGCRWPATAWRPPAGAVTFARLRLETPAVLTRRDRFIVRSYSPLVTIGGGVVLDPDPPRAGLRTARAAPRFAALALHHDLDADTRAALGRMLADAGLAGASTARLAQRLGVVPARRRGPPWPPSSRLAR